MNFNKTYNIQDGPAPADDLIHQKATNQKFQELLESGPSEMDVHRFLERNPGLVPGAWTPGTKSGHYPLHCALITQPKLQGLTTRIPDFMWISTHSSGWFPTLIEIESPQKKLFTKADGLTAEFTQARHQLEQWRTWFKEAINVQIFINMYQIPDYMRKGRQMEPHMILVYGRRGEFESDYARSKERLSLTGPDMQLMSFDRLSYDRELGEAVTVRLVGNRYKAVYVPPTFTLGPNLSGRLASIDGLNSAIQQNDEIAEDRKSFLIKRIPYWIEWQAAGAQGIICAGDRE